MATSTGKDAKKNKIPKENAADNNEGGISRRGGGGASGRKKPKDDGKESKGRRRRRGNGNGEYFAPLTDKLLAEEAALTAALFGGTGDADADAAFDDRGAVADSRGARKSSSTKTKKRRKEEGDDILGGRGLGGEGGAVDPFGSGGAVFAIDRDGEELGGEAVDGRAVEIRAGDDDDFDDDVEDDVDDYDSDSDSDHNGGAGGPVAAAWRDDDDDDDDDGSGSNEDEDEDDDESGEEKTKLTVSLTAGQSRIRKLRRHKDETDPLSLTEYEMRLRERFADTQALTAKTSWADVPGNDVDPGEDQRAKKKRTRSPYDTGYLSSSDDDSDSGANATDARRSNLFDASAPLFKYPSSSSSSTLPPSVLSVVRMQDANSPEGNRSVVRTVQFLPSNSDGGGENEERPLMLTAGMDKTLRFFRVDGEQNEKVHGIHFPTLPIHCAAFLGSTGSVILSGRRPYFYVYDAASGSVDKIPRILGRDERSLEKFVVNPAGTLVAFFGNDGYLILVDVHSRQWVGDLKMNGSVRAAAFSADGEYLTSSGSDGDVYRWHVRSRRCVERFRNEDGTVTSAIASSASDFLAVGAESGVVNLYDGGTKYKAANGSSITTAARAPLKSIMNLQTSADLLKFNHDGQILALSTRRETGGLKLCHARTGTVFANWPTSKTPLKYVWSLDFSPGSRFLAMGDDQGKCLLYKLNHYCDE